jgi:AcrR family transcriptional regulator
LIGPGVLIDESAQEVCSGRRVDGTGELGGGVWSDGGLGVVVARLRVRLDEIEGAIFARVREVVPDNLGGDNVEYMRGLRATVRAGVEFVLEGVERIGDGWGEGSVVMVPREPVLQARRAVRAGVSVDAVIRRYMAGQALLWEYILEEADRIQLADGGRQLRQALRVQSSLADRLVIDVAREHERELRRIQRLRSQGETARVQHRRIEGRDRRMQRVRVLLAMVELVGERGFANVSVRLLTDRAGVSTRAFYEQFDGLQDCFVAVLDLGLERAGELIARAFAREDRWQDGVLGALASLLVYFDSEPLLTRVWFVEAIAAGSWALERRERIVALLRAMIVDYWSPPGHEASIEPETVAGVMASVLGLIQLHVLAGESEPLIELLGPLMGLIAAHYLDRPGVEREVQRARRFARAIQTGETNWKPATLTSMQIVAGDSMFALPRASRARECLAFLAEHPNSSNKQVAVAIGVVHKSQISALLADLHRKGLLEKQTHGPGKPNAWRLTPTGAQLAQTLTKPEPSPR